MNNCKLTFAMVAALAAVAVLAACIVSDASDAYKVTIETDDHTLYLDLDDAKGEASLDYIKSNVATLNLSTVEYEGRTYSVTAVGGSAMYWDVVLTNVDLPNVVTVADEAFQNSAVMYVNLPSATYIGSQAFRESAIGYLTLPSCVTIGEYAFYDTDLYKISFGDSLADVGENAFGITYSDYEFQDWNGDAIGKTASDLAGKSFNRLDVGVMCQVPDAGYAFSQDGYQYVMLDTSSAKVVGGSPDPNGTVTIPSGVTVNSMSGNVRVDVTEVGKKAFYNNPDITSVVLAKGMSIGNKAFAYCVNLYAILDVYQYSYEREAFIGDYAFFKCGLTSLELPECTKTIGASAFSGCTKLTSLVIPAGIESIGDNAFNGLKFYLPDGETRLDFQSEQFLGHRYEGDCDKMVQIGGILPGETFSYQGLSFEVLTFDGDAGTARCCGNDPQYGSYRVLSIPSAATYKGCQFSVTSLASNAFKGDGILAEVTIPSTVTSIGGKAFANCDKLTRADFGKNSSLVTVGGYAFYGTSLSEITLPEGTKTIGASAFRGTHPEFIQIPSTVTGIGTDAFRGMSFYGSDGETRLDAVPENLSGSSFMLEDGKYILMTPVGTEFEYDGLVYKVTGLGSQTCSANLVGYVSAPAALVVPATVTFDGTEFQVEGIGAYAFYKCSTLKSLDTGNVTSIGFKAFASSGLTEVRFGEQLESISGYAFSRCAFTELVLPYWTASIGNSAFSGCVSIERLWTPYLCDYGTNVFHGLSFYHPDGETAIDVGGWMFNGQTFFGSDKILILEEAETGKAFVQGCLEYRIMGIDGNYGLAEVMGFAPDKAIADVVVPDEVLYCGIHLEVRKIADKAFYSDGTIRSVSMPHVETVGKKAFAGSSLVSVELPESNGVIMDYAFYKCRFSTLCIPEGVTTLGNSAFSGCTSVTRLAVLADCDYGTNVFYGLKIYKHDGVTRILDDDFDQLAGHVYEGSDKTLVEKLAAEVGDVFESGELKFRITYASDSGYRAEVTGFADGESTPFVTIPESVMLCGENGNALVVVDAVGARAFYHSSIVEEVNAAGALTIKERAFTSCPNLQIIDISGGAKYIGKYAFYGCYNVIEIRFPDLTGIGAHGLEHFQFHDVYGDPMEKDVGTLSDREFRGTDSSDLSLYL